MHSDPGSLTVAPAVDDRTVYSIVRIALVVVAGLVLLGLVSLLPGLEVLFVDVPVTLSALLLAAGTYLLAAGLLAMAPRISDLVSQCLEGPETVVDDAGATAAYLVAFGAILIAARGFAPALVPLVETVTAGIVYDFAFLFIALVPILLIARRLYRSLDPIAELVTRELLGSFGAGSNSNGNTESR